MAELGGGNGTSYPSSLDTDSSIEYNVASPSKTLARAEVPNDLAAAVIAIQTELGTDPAGSKTDVKTLLQIAHDTDGTHKSGASYPLATISDFTNSAHDHADAAGGGAVSTINMIRDTVRGLIIVNGGTSDEQVDVDADEIILQTEGGVAKRITSINLTIDNTAGAALNGLDVGTVAANKWYYIWVWNGTSGTAGFISLSSSIATVQAAVETVDDGYSTYGAIVGEIRTDATSDFEAIRKEGNRTQYTLITTNQRAATTAGDVGDPGNPTYVAVAVRGTTTQTVPPNAKRIFGTVTSTTNSTGWSACPNNSYGVIYSATNPPPIGAFDQGTLSFDWILESNNIYWAVDVGAATHVSIHILGWES